MASSRPTHLLLLAASLLISSCSGDETGPGDTGSASDTNDTAEKALYLPLVAGSTWEYDGTYPSMQVYGDTTVNRKTYAALRFAGEPTLYIRREGSTYYSLSPVSGRDTVILKEGEVGTTWIVDQSDPVLNTEKTVEYRIVEHRDRHTVNGYLYRDVLHVRATHYSGTTETGIGDFYYARGIGLVEHATSERLSDAFLKLRSFNIPGSDETVDVADAPAAMAYYDGILWKMGRIEYEEIDDYIFLAMSQTTSKSENTLVIALGQTSPGIYPLDTETTTATLHPNPFSGIRHTAGEVVILSSTPSEIEGTFWVDLENGRKFTEGKFRMIKR